MKKTTKKQNKTSYTDLGKHQPFIAIGLLLLGVFAGAMMGYYAWKSSEHDPRYALATSSELKAAKAAITAKFPSGCDDFDKYLKVNKYANRAVVRTCDQSDYLLAKNPLNGEWEQTTVNMALDARANPAWQVECLIDDITTADTKVRGENSSIDTYNLIGCRKIMEREQVVNILFKSGTFKRSELTQKDVDVYIKGAEDF